MAEKEASLEAASRTQAPCYVAKLTHFLAFGYVQLTIIVGPTRGQKCSLGKLAKIWDNGTKVFLSDFKRVETHSPPGYLARIRQVLRQSTILHMDLDKEVTAEVSEWDETLGKTVKVTKHGKGLVIFKATVKLPNGAIGTGTKMENAAAFGDFLEKAETGAIGCALASLGLGTAATDEMSEGEGHVVDAPVERKKPTYDPDKPATEQQLQTICRLQCELGMTELNNADGLSFGDCAAMLQDLNKRLQDKRKAC